MHLEGVFLLESWTILGPTMLVYPMVWYGEGCRVGGGWLAGWIGRATTQVGEIPLQIRSLRLFSILGPDIAFLYPDFTTALFGEFHEGILVKASEARISNLGRSQ